MAEALCALIGCVCVCVYRCSNVSMLCYVLCDETSADRFGGHLVALFLWETKEQPLPKLALCQGGREAVSGGTTSPPFDWLSHTLLGISWHPTSLSGWKLLLSCFGLCCVSFEVMCCHFSGSAQQQETLTACGWSTVWKLDESSTEHSPVSQKLQLYITNLQQQIHTCFCQYFFFLFKTSQILQTNNHLKWLQHCMFMFWCSQHLANLKERLWPGLI